MSYSRILTALVVVATLSSVGRTEIRIDQFEAFPDAAKCNSDEDYYMFGLLTENGPVVPSGLPYFKGLQEVQTLSEKSFANKVALEVCADKDGRHRLMQIIQQIPSAGAHISFRHNLITIEDPKPDDGLTNALFGDVSGPKKSKSRTRKALSIPFCSRGTCSPTAATS